MLRRPVFLMLTIVALAGCGSEAADDVAGGAQISLTGAVTRSYPSGPDWATCNRGLPYGGDGSFLNVNVIDPEFKTSLDGALGEPNTVGLSVTVSGSETDRRWPSGTFVTGANPDHDVDVRVTPGVLSPDAIGDGSDLHAASYATGEPSVGSYKIFVAADGLSGNVEATAVDTNGTDAPITVNGSWRCEE